MSCTSILFFSSTEIAQLKSLMKNESLSKEAVCS